jgi:hypothetical protein
MSDKPPKPTDGDVELARVHDGAFNNPPCSDAVCAVRRRAEWENKIMREAINETLLRRDHEAPAILRATLEEIDR